VVVALARRVNEHPARLGREFVIVRPAPSALTLRHAFRPAGRGLAVGETVVLFARFFALVAGDQNIRHSSLDARDRDQHRPFASRQDSRNAGTPNVRFCIASQAAFMLFP
jgi:hypothetical protein